MAQQQRNVTLAAPGFMGLNTQLSPLAQPAAYASVADNCIIDQLGRIAVRKGQQLITQNAGAKLGSDPITKLGEFIGDDAEHIIFCTGSLEIFRHTQVGDSPDAELVSLTVASTPTADDWQIVPFNNKCYFVQAGHQPVYYDHAVGTDVTTAIVNPGAGPPGSVDLSQASCSLAAFGRLWLGGNTANGSQLIYSALLDGTDFTTSSGAGGLDLNEVWPTGNDTIQALAAHNEFLIIFGLHSILVYAVPMGGASVSNVGPDYMTLVDTIAGVGCISRDTVAHTGNDLLFVDASGVRSFKRTIQEKSMPIGNISLPIKEDLRDALRAEGLPNPSNVKAFYDLDDSVYYLFLPASSVTYAFDVRFMGGEEQTARVTLWPGNPMLYGYRQLDGESIFCGPGGLFDYGGTVDKVPDGGGTGGTDNVAIQFKYYTHPLDFDDPENPGEITSREKFVKQVDATIIGNAQDFVTLKWGYDYEIAIDSIDEALNLGLISEFNIAEFGDNGVPLSEYNSSNIGVTQLQWNTWGSGRNITLGWEAQVDGSNLAIQEFNIQALIGRIL